MKLTRQQRKHLIQIGRAYDAHSGLDSYEIGDYLTSYMLEREDEYGLANVPAMDVSDYAYGVARWIVGKEQW